MKYFLTIAFAMALTQASAHATELLCSGTAGTNNITGTNQTIIAPSVYGTNPGPCGAWASFSNTGEGGFVPPNTTLAGSPTAVFRFDISTLGNLTIMGYAGFDDTGSLTVCDATHPCSGGSYSTTGGLQVFATNPLSDDHCAKGETGCEPGEFKAFNTVVNNTSGGAYVLLPAYQTNGYQFGFNLGATVTPNADAPEPSTWGMIAGGLALGSCFRRRR